MNDGKTPVGKEPNPRLPQRISKTGDGSTMESPWRCSTQPQWKQGEIRESPTFFEKKGQDGGVELLLVMTAKLPGGGTSLGRILRKKKVL